MRLRILIATGLIQGCSLLAQAQTPGPSGATGQAPKPSTQPGKAATSQPTPESQGEKKFQQYCNRCHNPPEELSPRIAGTIALHMRVRASLSAADEREILRYLAP